MSESGTVVLIKYLTEHVGEEVPLQTLNEICGSAGLHHWDRVIRNLKQQQGYDISNKRGEWYKLNSLERKTVKGKRGYINKKLRFLVLERDNYTCQACGRTPADGIKLVMDHVVPVDWGGEQQTLIIYRHYVQIVMKEKRHGLMQKMLQLCVRFVCKLTQQIV